MKALTIALALIAITGCTHRIVDFTIASTKNVELSRMGALERHPIKVEGKDTKHIVVVIPTGTPSVEEAMDQAVESVPGGVAMVDGVVSSSWWYIPYIFGAQTMSVEGTVLVDPDIANRLPAPAVSSN